MSPILPFVVGFLGGVSPVLILVIGTVGAVVFFLFLMLRRTYTGFKEGMKGGKN